MFTLESHIQGLIFDFDGTLADTMPLHYQAWQTTVQDHNAEFPEDLFYAWAGVPSDKVVMRLNEAGGYQLNPLQIMEEKEARFIKIIHQVQPIEPVVAIAKQYKNKLPMAVATGGIPEVVIPMMRTLGFENFFDALVTAADVENGKPAPDTFLEAARRINIVPEACHVFEDADLGLEGAQRAGMTTTDVRPWYR